MVPVELTDWFDPSIKPVRPGPYQRQIENGMVVYSLWTGQEWGRNGVTANEAANCDGPSLNQELPWRGAHGLVVGVAGLQGAEDELIYESPFEVAE
jgi:hypothetical protein